MNPHIHAAIPPTRAAPQLLRCSHLPRHNMHDSPYLPAVAASGASESVKHAATLQLPLLLFPHLLHCSHLPRHGHA
jgi:hypothetical protein